MKENWQTTIFWKRNNLMKLKIIIASVRPSRQGHLVGEWFAKYAKENSSFDVEVLDLKKINLPLMDEEAHPKLGQYQNEHTLAWSRVIDEADAFVAVTPEYNFSMPPSLKNAFDYLFKEWAEKPIGFVSYGGASGGMRAVQALKLPATTLSMMPITQAVNIHFYQNYIEDNVFVADEKLEKSADILLEKLMQWAEALKGMREKNNIKV